MRHVVIDTDISSGMFKNNLPPILVAKLSVFIPVLTFVTRAELAEWTRSREWGELKCRRLREWMGQTALLRGDKATADAFSVLAEGAQRRGRPWPTNTMWIAACCLARGLPLATLNVNDFHDFAVYHGLELITA